MSKNEIKAFLAYLDEEYNKMSVQAFKDAIRVLQCDLKFRLKRLEERGSDTDASN